MARYKINHRYLSSVIGFDEGAVVDIDDTLAEWLERDSPGVLTALDTDAPEPTPEAVPAELAAEPEPEPEPEPEAEPEKPRAKRTSKA